MSIREFIHEYRLAIALIFFGTLGALLGWVTDEGVSAFVVCMPMAVLCYLTIRILDIIEVRSRDKNGHNKRPNSPPQ